MKRRRKQGLERRVTFEFAPARFSSGNSNPTRKRGPELTSIFPRLHGGLPKQGNFKTRQRGPLCSNTSPTRQRGTLRWALIRQSPLLVLLFIAALGLTPASAQESQTIAVVIGAGGAPEYEEAFGTWADRWRQAAEMGHATHVEIGRGDSSEQTDREQLEQFLANQHEPSNEPLWLIFIGHGTYFRELAKFNLRGPDVAADDLAAWVEPVQRPLIVVNCASSSGPFMNKLSGPHRIIVTATKSGAEQNYARFGDYLSKAITDSAADLDHDERVSLLEAFLSAAGEVAKFYEQESRLATEHALLDDNGDKLGTPANFFRGIRPARAPRGEAKIDGSGAARVGLISSAGQDNFNAEQLAERDRLEDAIEQLRAAKADMNEAAYYEQLEPLMVQLARLYNAAD